MYKTFVRFRSWLLVYLTHKLALPVLKVIRKPEVFAYSREQLKTFPESTLGRALVDMLDGQQLELLTHYARHDMKHILLDYPTTDEGEVCLQAFMLGNGHVSFPVIVTVAFGVVLMPEHWRVFISAYQRGTSAKSMSGWNWNQLVHEQTVVVQQRIFNH